MRSPGTRRGRICSRYQRSERSWTSASTRMASFMARAIHCSRSGVWMGRATSVIRRPTSAGVSPMNAAARRVKRRMRPPASSIRMGISTASSRFRTSALTSCRSWFRPWSSSFTVVSSSFVAWSSSLAVSSSSLRLCSSSLPETSSSLAEASASVPRPCSSSSADTCSFVEASSSSSARRADASNRDARPRDRALGAGTAEGCSSKSTTNACSSSSAAFTGSTTRSQVRPAPAPSMATPFLLHRGGRLACLSQREAQRYGEAGARHLEELALGLARRWLEVGTGSPAELEHLQALVDDHAGRAVARQHCAVGAAAPGRRPPSPAGRPGWTAGARRAARPRAARGGTCSARACAGGSGRPCSPGRTTAARWRRSPSGRGGGSRAG